MHARIWTALALALAFMHALSAVTLTWVAFDASRRGNPAWALFMVVTIQAMFIAAILATLLARAVSPAGLGRIATITLNLILLISVPLGTALGIYGLLQVCQFRDPEPAGVAG